jgi:hypothetical protein
MTSLLQDRNLAKSRMKKLKYKSSSCNRDESTHSTGGNGSKPENSREHQIESSEKQAIKETLQIDKHMNSFLDDCLTEDKSFIRSKSKKRSRNKNRPNTSLFNKKRKSSGNTTLSGFKNNLYRPSSAFAVSSKTKSKSKVKKSNNPGKVTSINKYISNTSFDVILRDTNKLKSRTKLDLVGNKHPTADMSSDSFDIQHMNVPKGKTISSQCKTTNRVTSRSKNTKPVKKSAQDEAKRNYIPDYKILKMLSKEDLMNNSSLLIGKTNPKINTKQIKPNANNYVSKAVNQKSNYSTAIENLVNQAIKYQNMQGNQANSVKKVKSKSKVKHSANKDKSQVKSKVSYHIVIIYYDYRCIKN